MRVSYLLLVAALVLASGSALAQRPVPMLTGTPSHRYIHANALQVLYSQSGDRGTGINSQNYDHEFDAYDDEAADDFIVPEGARWRIKEVDMAGYYNEGPADTFTITFYKNRHGKPGNMIATFTIVPPYYNGDGSMPLALDGYVTLKPGHYWVSIVADQNFGIGNGQWSWASRDVTTYRPAVWRVPGDGFGIGCTEWTVDTECIPDGQGDHVFTLKGKSL